MFLVNSEHVSCGYNYPLATVQPQLSKPRLSELWSQAYSAGQNTNIGHDFDMHMHGRVQCSHHSLCLGERQLGALKNVQEGRIELKGTVSPYKHIFSNDGDSQLYVGEQCFDVRITPLARA